MVKNITLIFVLTIFSTYANRGTSDIKSMKPSFDGTFQIFCIDNTIEYLTAEEVEDGKACSHMTTLNFESTLIAQEIDQENKKLCEYSILTKKSSLNDYFKATIQQDSFCSGIEYNFDCIEVSENKSVCENNDISFEIIYAGLNIGKGKDRYIMIMNDFLTGDKGEYSLKIK